TLDPAHPGVARTLAMGPYLVAGPIDLLAGLPHPFARYRLFPRETRVLFREKGWRTIVGFQTRNVPHLGHEYVQKTALAFVDGIFVNPVLGRKKPGDFRDEVILEAYEALLAHYYLRPRAVLSVLHTEMRSAGPREAVFHAILRKNFGCTHFVVGRDHAGVGSFYPPYAAQEIFDEFPDLGIVPLFFTAFFHCHRCGTVANEKTCPHPVEHRVPFSGTALRRALEAREGEAAALIRPEVAEVVRRHPAPFVAARPAPA
ncbi:MAG: sulfate adenylyltransferase, partial [Armatimonadota bacterium]|nr:sulfate adenylyltransferase [Armatimonadota bacterium]